MLLTSCAVMHVLCVWREGGRERGRERGPGDSLIFAQQGVTLDTRQLF